VPSPRVSDSFPSRASQAGQERLEPALPMAIPAPEAITLPPAGALAKAEQTRNLHRLRVAAISASLALHLLPAVLLVSWSADPANVAETIPVQLVIEAPPPAAPAPEPAKPASRRLASDEAGPIAGPKPQSLSRAQQPEAELKTALAAPEPPPEPLPRPDALLELPPPKPPPSKPAVRRPDAPIQLAGPSGWRVLTDETATRDEYLALLKRLTQRHLDLLPPSFIAGRRGDAYLTVVVLSDGTIARIAVARSSGYQDIDERVGRMIAAVGRFPPIPARFQTPSLELIMHLRFPEGVDR